MWWHRNSDISNGISSNSWAQHSVFPPSLATNHLVSTVSAHCVTPVNLSSFTGSRTAWRPVCPSVGHCLHVFLYISVFSTFFQPWHSFYIEKNPMAPKWQHRLFVYLYSLSVKPGHPKLISREELRKIDSHSCESTVAPSQNVHFVLDQLGEIEQFFTALLTLSYGTLVCSGTVVLRHCSTSCWYFCFTLNDT